MATSNRERVGGEAARRIDSPFAYADAYDEPKGRYAGLAFGGRIPAVRADGLSVVVRIEAAERQRAAETPPPVSVPGGSPKARRTTCGGWSRRTAGR